jgi:hypothetical protein
MAFLLFAAAAVGFSSWLWRARRLTGDAAQDASLRRTLRRTLIVSWLLLGAALVTSWVLRLAVHGVTASEVRGHTAVYGFLVLPREAAAYGMRPGDTIPELRDSEVSPSLKAVTDASGHPIGTSWGPFDTRCTRYFSSSRPPIVLYYSAICPEADYWIADVPKMAVVFNMDSAGDLRAMPGPDLRPQLVPAGRAIDGRPISVGQPRRVGEAATLP